MLSLSPSGLHSLHIPNSLSPYALSFPGKWPQTAYLYAPACLSSVVTVSLKYYIYLSGAAGCSRHKGKGESTDGQSVNQTGKVVCVRLYKGHPSALEPKACILHP